MSHFSPGALNAAKRHWTHHQFESSINEEGAGVYSSEGSRQSPGFSHAGWMEGDLIHSRLSIKSTQHLFASKTRRKTKKTNLKKWMSYFILVNIKSQKAWHRWVNDVGLLPNTFPQRGKWQIKADIRPLEKKEGGLTLRSIWWFQKKKKTHQRG